MVEPNEGAGITVDLDGLHDFARKLRQETDVLMRRCLQRAELSLTTGVPFGAASHSGYVHAARQRYDASAARAVATLNQYVQMAEALADAAETIAQRYADSDAFAAARADEVQREYDAALLAVRSRPAGSEQPEVAP